MGLNKQKGNKPKPQICDKCGCEIKDKLDSESCWCDVVIRIK